MGDNKKPTRSFVFETVQGGGAFGRFGRNDMVLATYPRGRESRRIKAIGIAGLLVLALAADPTAAADKMADLPVFFGGSTRMNGSGVVELIAYFKIEGALKYLLALASKQKPRFLDFLMPLPHANCARVQRQSAAPGDRAPDGQRG